MKESYPMSRFLKAKNICWTLMIPPRQYTFIEMVKVQKSKIAHQLSIPQWPLKWQPQVQKQINKIKLQLTSLKFNAKNQVKKDWFWQKRFPMMLHIYDRTTKKLKINRLSQNQQESKGLWLKIMYFWISIMSLTPSLDKLKIGKSFR